MVSECICGSAHSRVAVAFELTGLSPLQSDLFQVLVLAWVVSEIALQVRSRSGPLLDQLRSRQDRYSVVGIFAAFVSSELVAWFTNQRQILLAPDWVAWVGLAALLVGVWVRGWALFVLGRFFSPLVRTTTDQRFIRNGPYRWIRHPAYTGILLEWIGVILVLLSPLGLLVALITCGAAFAYRIRVEEAALLERFGDEYRSYRAETRRIIPFVL